MKIKQQHEHRQFGAKNFALLLITPEKQFCSGGQQIFKQFISLKQSPSSSSNGGGRNEILVVTENAAKQVRY